MIYARVLHSMKNTPSAMARYLPSCLTRPNACSEGRVARKNHGPYSLRDRLITAQRTAWEVR